MPKNPIDPNAVMALNQLKLEIAHELGIDPNLKDRERDLSGTVDNIYQGGKLGGNMVKRIIEMSERKMIDQ